MGTRASPRISAFHFCILFLFMYGVSGEFRCSEGFKIHADKCFFINTTSSLNWFHAVDACRNRQTELVKVYGLPLRAFFGKSLRGNVWIGATDFNEFRAYRWLDGTDLALAHQSNFSSWGPGEPNGGRQDCVALNGFRFGRVEVASWDDVSCNSLNMPLCQHDLGHHHQCRPGWTNNAGRCYFYNATNATTFTAAEEFCRSLNATLASPGSQVESDFIKDKVMRRNATMAWIGLRRRPTDPQFRWIKDHSLPKVANWAVLQPNNALNEVADCGYLGGTYTTNIWNSINCGAHADYLCERPRGAGCPTGWSEAAASRRCLLPGSKTANFRFLSWTEARDKCAGMNASLVVMKDASVMTDIRKIPRTSHFPFWIGLRDEDHDGEFVWIDGTKLNTSALRRYPTSARRKLQMNCVAVMTSRDQRGRWTNVDCRAANGYVCAKRNLSDACSQSGWFPLGRRCHRIFLDARNAVNASSACQLHQADLARIETAGQQEQLHDKISALKLKYPNVYIDLWIGLRAFRRNKFSWTNDSQGSPSYTNWFNDRPQKIVEEHCLSMVGYGYSRVVRWSDKNCFLKLGYVCSTKAEGDTSYYDFMLNQTAYYINPLHLTRNEGRRFCREHYGANATMLSFQDMNQFQEFSNELSKRVVTSAAQFWLADDIDEVVANNLNVVKNPLQPRYFSRQSVSGSSNCAIIALTPFYLRRRTYSYLQIHPKLCCEERPVICQKDIGSELEEHYTMIMNETLYLMPAKEKLSQSEAADQCQGPHAMDGLVEVASEAMLQFLSAEIRSRHRGNVFSYWVYGNATATNESLPYANFSKEPQPGEECLALVHPDFPVKNSARVLDLLPVRCDGRRHFVCARDLDLAPDLPGSVIGSKFISDGAEAPQRHPAHVDGNLCNAVCIGLAVMLPFAAILPAILVAAYFLYFRKNVYTRFSYKASDEIHLTESD